MTTGVTPTELLEPAISDRVKNTLHLQKHQHNIQAIGYPVFVFDFPTGKKWTYTSMMSVLIHPLPYIRNLWLLMIQLSMPTASNPAPAIPVNFPLAAVDSSTMHPTLYLQFLVD